MLREVEGHRDRAILRLSPHLVNNACKYSIVHGSSDHLRRRRPQTCVPQRVPTENLPNSWCIAHVHANTENGTYLRSPQSNIAPTFLTEMHALPMDFKQRCTPDTSIFLRSGPLPQRSCRRIVNSAQNTARIDVCEAREELCHEHRPHWCPASCIHKSSSDMVHVPSEACGRRSAPLCDSILPTPVYPGTPRPRSASPIMQRAIRRNQLFFSPTDRKYGSYEYHLNETIIKLIGSSRPSFVAAPLSTADPSTTNELSDSPDAASFATASFSLTPVRISLKYNLHSVMQRLAVAMNRPDDELYPSVQASKHSTSVPGNANAPSVPYILKTPISDTSVYYSFQMRQQEAIKDPSKEMACPVTDTLLTDKLSATPVLSVQTQHRYFHDSHDTAPVLCSNTPEVLCESSDNQVYVVRRFHIRHSKLHGYAPPASPELSHHSDNVVTPRSTIETSLLPSPAPGSCSKCNMHSAMVEYLKRINDLPLTKFPSSSLSETINDFPSAALVHSAENLLEISRGNLRLKATRASVAYDIAEGWWHDSPATPESEDEKVVLYDAPLAQNTFARQIAKMVTLRKELQFDAAPIYERLDKMANSLRPVTSGPSQASSAELPTVELPLYHSPLHSAADCPSEHSSNPQTPDVFKHLEGAINSRASSARLLEEVHNPDDPSSPGNGAVSTASAGSLFDLTYSTAEGSMERLPSVLASSAGLSACASDGISHTNARDTYTLAEEGAGHMRSRKRIQPMRRHIAARYEQDYGYLHNLTSRDAFFPCSSLRARTLFARSKQPCAVGSSDMFVLTVKNR